MDARTSHYHDVYAHWQRNPEVFWAEAAAEIDWYEKPKKVFEKDAGIYGHWFAGATCNTCYNAIDRHVLRGRNDQPALIYDSPVTNSDIRGFSRCARPARLGLERHAPAARGSGITHALGRLARGRSLRSRLGRRILRSALCLQSLGMKHAIASEAAFRQRLRVVFKRIRRRLGAGVAHIQRTILLYQNKVHVRPAALNGSWLHIARDAQALAVCPIAHGLQLFDGDVVALAVLHAGVGEVPEHHQDGDGRRTKLQTLAGLA